MLPTPGTGTASPQLWNCVEFTILPIAELFLERCKYDPHILFVNGSELVLSQQTIPDPRREAVWEKMEGRTFNNLRSLVFEGGEHEFARKVVGLLRRAPNVSNLDLNNILYDPTQELPWPISDLIPNLSTLRLHNFSICWTSPLLRNLTRLTLGSEFPQFPPEHVSIEMFLAALANCPDLEILDLTHTGPELLNSRQSNCDVVIQLRRLRELSLKFLNPSTVGCILSHIGYPESTRLAVYVQISIRTDLAESISQVLPHRNVQAIQHFRQSTFLTVYPDYYPQFSANNLLVHFQEPGIHTDPYRNPQAPARLASKIVEVVGGDTIISLTIESWRIDLPEGMWEALLHGLPRLARISYRRTWEESDFGLVNSFIFVFSRPFEGQPVCPSCSTWNCPGGGAKPGLLSSGFETRPD